MQLKSMLLLRVCWCVGSYVCVEHLDNCKLPQAAKPTRRFRIHCCLEGSPILKLKHHDFSSLVSLVSVQWA